MSVEQNLHTGPAAAPAGVRMTAGIDWASADHAVAIVDGAGVTRDRFCVAHRATELRRLVTRLRRAGVIDVAIERPDGPVVDALLEAGLVVFVIAPNQIKNLRSRYGQAGNKDDRFDAYVLADVLRTDRARLRPLTRDSEQTVTLRMTVRARQDLVTTRVAVANQLRAHLQITLPGAVDLFRDIDSHITQAFLRRFPNQNKADWLSPARLEKWLRSVAYNHMNNLDRLWTHLHDAPRGTTGPQGRRPWPHHYGPGRDAERPQGPDRCSRRPDRSPARDPSRRGDLHLAAQVRHRTRRPTTRRDRRRPRPLPHPRSARLPRRRRTLDQTIRQSQSRRVPLGRRQQLRGAVIDFAGDSHHANPWAAHLYRKARDRGHDHPHAVRILARAWLHIIWRCWQDNVPYDPAKHRALQRVLADTACGGSGSD
jgi:hypothetical protein